MKIVMTGSLGRIGRPLTQTLVQEGHGVTVISANPDRKNEIGDLGALPAIGTLEDVDFLTRTFSGADVVYVMIPTVNFRKGDIFGFWMTVGKNYAAAIRQSGVKHIVHLSSIGAHKNKDNGMLSFHYEVEQIFRQLPEEVIIKTLRPVGFFNNLLGTIHTIKTQGVIASNYKVTYKEPWVATVDVAAVAAEEITTPFSERTVRYIASDMLTSDDTARVLGAAIGKPDLKWVIVPPEKLEQGMIAAGMNPLAARGLLEINNAIQAGSLYEDYRLHPPAHLGKVKMINFAKEFAAIYHRN